MLAYREGLATVLAVGAIRGSSTPQHCGAVRNDRRRFAKQIRELQEPVVGGNFPPLLGTGCSKRSALALTVGDIKMGSSERARCLRVC
jgi:hypothetical protein